MIDERLEELSEAVVMVDPTDLPGLSDLHTILENLREEAASGEAPVVAEAAEKTMALVESVILSEVSDTAAAMATLSEAVQAMQSCVRDGTPPEEAGFPAALKMSCTAVAPAYTGEAADGEVDEQFLNFQLPSYVDEQIFGEFLARQGGVLEEVEGLVLGLERGGDTDDLAALRRIVHTVKGESAMLGLQNVEQLCHRIEDACDNRAVTDLTDALLNAKDWLGRAFDAYAGKGPAPEPVARIIEQLEGRAAAPSEPEPAAAAPSPVPEETEEPEFDLPAEAVALQGDLSLVGDFVAEAQEHLENADVHLLTLETEPEDEDAMNAVFRAFHTIKGVAGFLGLPQVQALSHEAETLLDMCRKKELTLAGAVIDVVFESVDFLKRLVENVGEALRTATPVPVESELRALLLRIRAVGQGQESSAEAPAVAEPGQRVGDILVERGQASAEAVREAAEKQQGAVERQKLGEVLHRYFQLSEEHVEEAVEIQQREPGRKLGEILVSLGAITQAALDEAIRIQKEKGFGPRFGEVLVSDFGVPAKDVAQALRSQSAGQQEPEPDQARQQQAVKVKESVKVDADRLDSLVDAIGELVIAESMVAQSPELREGASPDLLRHLSQLDKITRELQEMGTSLRMVPVRSTFQKMARLVRDLAKKSGKKVDFVMTGEDTELDKTVVDRIGDPLVHMVRNAVDHGLEATPEDRVAAGKPEMGTVELRAFHKGGSIYIEIEDNGRGLNRDAILAKAVERGLIQADAKLEDRDIWQLIFEPGFSTASKITDVSGRGVGMDVVRRNIEILRGQIDIRSKSGKGSVFSIRLPLTLAIIDGMVVRVGPERYIVPTLSILTSIRPEPEDLSTVVGRGEMLRMQGELVPLFRLGKLFGLEGCKDKATEAIVMVLEDEGKKVGILMDDILGQQQTVIKSLGAAMKDIPGIAGGAIMPDGEVGLIVDVSGLVKLAHSEGPQQGTVG